MTDETKPASRLEQVSHAATNWDTTARYIGLILLALVGYVALRLIAPILQLVFMTFILSFLFHAPVRGIARRWNMSNTRALIVVYAGVVIIIVLALLLIPRIINNINLVLDNMGNAVADAQRQMQAYQPEDGTVTVGDASFSVDFLIQPIRDFITNGATAAPTPPAPIEGLSLRSTAALASTVGAGIAGFLGGFVTTVAGYTFLLLFSLLVTYFVLLDWPNRRGLLNQLISPAYDREVSLILCKLDETWGGFFRGEFIIGLIMTAISLVQYWLMGVPAPVPLAFLNGFLGIIPGIGGPLSSVIVSIPCLLLGSTVLTGMSNLAFAILVLVLNAVVTSVAYTLISPFVLGKATKLPIPLVMVGSFIGLAAGGILGAFLAVPLISSFLLLVSYLIAKVYARDPFPGEPAPASAVGFLSQLYQPAGLLTAAPPRPGPSPASESVTGEPPTARRLEQLRHGAASLHRMLRSFSQDKTKG